MRYAPIFSVVCCLGLGISSISCSSSDPPAAGAVCTNFDYSKYVQGTAMPKFETEIMPIFQSGQCALAAACHLNGANKPNLGGPGVTAAMISAAIVEIPSDEVPMLKFVAKGAPESSYLMRKLETANPGCGLTCTTTVKDGCSTRMPAGGADPLSAADQATIRDWIKQGAQ